MIRYVREAALREKDAPGNAIAEERRIVVFPGMELTLNPECRIAIASESDLPALGDEPVRPSGTFGLVRGLGPFQLRSHGV